MYWIPKQIRVEAVQYKEGKLDDVPFWIASLVRNKILVSWKNDPGPKFRIGDREYIPLNEGDYIVRDSLTGRIHLYGQVEFEQIYQKCPRKIKRRSDITETLTVEEVRLFSDFYKQIPEK